MILPRPVLDDYLLVMDFLEDKFGVGEEFYMVNTGAIYRWIGINASKLVVKCALGKRFSELGVMDVYCHVQKDIGLAQTINEGGYSAEQWLFSGIDGKRNVDRLCLAFSMNNGLIPNGNEKGNKLREILAEANRMIGSMTPKDNKVIIEIIDNQLGKLGTYLDKLAEESGLKLSNDYSLLGR